MGVEGVDGVEGTEAAGTVSVKMVEVSDPHNQLPSRSQVPPLSAEQEERIVNRKLESAAQRYNQLVTWQLQHTREQHEMRLQRLRAFIRQETSIVGGTGTTSGSGGSGSGGGSGAKRADDAPPGAGFGHGMNWTSALLQLAASEKTKLLKQCDAARQRLAAAREEAVVLRELNVSLLQNKEEWQRRVDAAQTRLVEVQHMQRTWISKLEEKVASLMAQLDAAPPQAPPSSSLPSLGK